VAFGFVPLVENILLGICHRTFAMSVRRPSEAVVKHVDGLGGPSYESVNANREHYNSGFDCRFLCPNRPAVMTVTRR
jgi:hypothetical protein